MMSDMLIEEPRMLDLQAIDCVDVDAVSAGRIAFAITAELAVDDADRAARYSCRQDAVLVVDEAAVLHRQVAAFGPDSGTVVIWHRGAGKGDVADRDAIPQGDEDPSAGTHFIRERRSGAGSLDRQVAGAPHRAIGVVALRDADG